MLRKEVHYIPLSPKKLQATQVPAPIRRHRRGLSSFSLYSESDVESSSSQETETLMENIPGLPSPTKPNTKANVRTTEQKKHLLGELLGNVDALVDGVKKAGIWGLG